MKRSKAGRDDRGIGRRSNNADDVALSHKDLPAEKPKPCSEIWLHNFPNLKWDTKCKDCGKTVDEISGIRKDVEKALAESEAKIKEKDKQIEQLKWRLYDVSKDGNNAYWFREGQRDFKRELRERLNDMEWISKWGDEYWLPKSKVLELLEEKPKKEK